MELSDLLRGRETTTVNDLADELGVSRRTLLRDLASLRQRHLARGVRFARGFTAGFPLCFVRSSANSIHSLKPRAVEVA
jgi:predicted DNA-binding transcriptional regulator YafY